MPFVRLSLIVLGVLAAGPALAQAKYPGKVPSLQSLKIDESIKIDGVLDEAIWQQAPIATGFLQQEPNEGAPATEKTEARVMYNKKSLYIGVWCYDSNPSAIVANRLGIDAGLQRDDSIAILLDTFHDRRNSYYFETNANSARTDILVADEGADVNVDWEGVWQVRCSVNDQGWQAEFEIPFSTLRFNPNSETWGFQVHRIIRHKNELVFWSPVFLDADIMRVSKAGTLTGLRGMETGRNLNIKPYVTSGWEKRDGFSTDNETDGGLDVKWGVSRNLNLDLTINTDFAETEVDAQQVNLTRFSLFFPEKREFFLENAGIFEFHKAGTGGLLMKPFHSRRIGLARNGSPVPINWGARFTGRVSGWNFGVLDMETEEDDTGYKTNWGVLRVEKNLGRRSSVGMIFTNRDGDDGLVNRVYGVDGAYKPNDYLTIAGNYLRSEENSDVEDDWSGAFSINGIGRSLRWNMDYTQIGEDYNPGMGFLFRRATRRYTQGASYRHRPKNKKIRHLQFAVQNAFFTDLDDKLDSRELNADLFSITFRSWDEIALFGESNEERLDSPFYISDGVTIEEGEYRFSKAGIRFSTNYNRKLTGGGEISSGDFYDGSIDSQELWFQWRPNKHIKTDTFWSHNDIELPGGDFSTTILSQKVDVAFTSDLTTGVNFQYNDSGDLAALNMRFHWRYRPGSGFFVVYNQNWEATSLSDLEGEDRKLILKFNFLYQR